MSGLAGQDIVITGFGVVVPGAYGVDSLASVIEASDATLAQRDSHIEDFVPQKLLSDKRMMKALSRRDAVGLAAVEDLRKHAKLAVSDFAPERIGMYVGAPQSNSTDNHYYVDAIEQTKDVAGQYHERAFGKTCMGSKPTTLLMGLPNNVLCYGSMVLDARGPNSNYTSGELSGQIAIMMAARQVQRQRIDIAVAGGYAQHADGVSEGALRFNGWLTPNEKFPTGSVFVALETRASAVRRNAKIFMRYVGSKIRSAGQGPIYNGANAFTIIDCVGDLLSSVGVRPEQVGVVCLTGYGIPKLEGHEWEAVKSVFAENLNGCVMLASGRHFGQLMESGGLVDLPLMADLVRRGSLPTHLLAAESARNYDPKRRFGLVIRSSYFGDASAMLVELHGSVS